MMAAAETAEGRRKRAGRILVLLHKHYANADCALQFAKAWHLLVATVLSAQSTDETVNRVTSALFKKYPTPGALMKAPLAELEQDVYASGFFRQKARNIQRICKQLVTEHGGSVPDTMESLVLLPGVARKTANVVLGTWFKKNEGVVVDTHVGRIAERLALSVNARNSKDAVRIERDLMDVLPQREWTFFSHAIIHHGRALCSARRLECDLCPLSKQCPSNAAFSEPPPKKQRRRSRQEASPVARTRSRRKA